MIAPYLIPWHESFHISVPAFQWLLTATIPLIWFNRKWAYKGMITWATLCYFLACIISTIVALDPWISTFGMFGTHRAGLFQTAILLILFHLVRQKDDKPLRESIIMVGAWCGVLCVYQVVGMNYFGVDPAFGSRAWGLLGSPVFSGALLAASLVAVGLPEPHDIKKQVAFFIIAVGLLLTESRGPWVGVIIGFLAIYNKRVSLYTLLVVIVALMAFIWRDGASQREVGRQLTMELAFKGIEKRPIGGIGGDSFGLLVLSMPPKFASRWKDNYRVHWQDHSHNSIVEVILARGFIGMSWAIIIMIMVLNIAKGWQLGVILSIFLYSLLNPLALPVKAILVLVSGSCFRGRGIGRIWSLSLVLLAVPLWHWSHEWVLRTSEGKAKIDAAVALDLVERRIMSQK